MPQRASRALARQAILVDQPEPGFFKLRLAPGCWDEVPCRIIHRENEWAAEIDGQAQTPHPDPIHAPGVLDIWHAKKVAISAAEYEFLTTRLKAWAREFYPDHPLLHPREKLKAGALRPIPQFSAPPAPEPLAEEPLPENRPAPPRPMSEAEIAAWLDFENEALTKAIERDVGVISKDADIEIADDDTLARVAANADLVRQRIRSADDARKRQKAPFWDGGKAVDAWFDRWISPLKKALDPIQKAMNAYGARVEAERRRAAEEEARKRREEADRIAAQAAEALRRNQSSVEAEVKLGAAQVAATIADDAADTAMAKAADFTRTRSAYGKVVSGREIFGWELEDISKIPIRFLQINERLMDETVREYAKRNIEAARAGVPPVDGIRIIRTLSMQSR